MARSRNIKPGFFRNDRLVELPFEYRILFCGLWVLADREGRLEDRPKRIRMEIFPADDVDVNAGLEALSVSGFITRYAVVGQRYIQIDNFLKHQNPHYKEADSVIPKPEASPGLSPSSIEQQSEARLGQASDSERVDRGVNRADSLIPDSLIPDSKNLAPSAVSESREPSSANAVSPLQAERTVEEQQLLPSPPAAGRAAPPTVQRKKSSKSPIPEDFGISRAVLEWARKNNHSQLEARLEDFVGKAKAKGYVYADWDQAFMGAIRGDWAKLNGRPAAAQPADCGPREPTADEIWAAVGGPPPISAQVCSREPSPQVHTTCGSAWKTFPSDASSPNPRSTHAAPTH